MPFTTIGSSLGMSQSQARKRVTRLVQNRVIRITALADPRSLGFGVQAWVTLSVRPGHSGANAPRR